MDQILPSEIRQNSSKHGGTYLRAECELQSQAEASFFLSLKPARVVEDMLFLCAHWKRQSDLLTLCC